MIAGDEDYLTLVNEVKRYGARINGAFFNRGLSDELKLSFDTFRELGKHELIREDWEKISQIIEKGIINQQSNKK